MSLDVVASAITLLHRFYSVRSMKANDRTVIGMTCLLLAGKAEDQHRAIADIIKYFWRSRCCQPLHSKSLAAQGCHKPSHELKRQLLCEWIPYLLPVTACCAHCCAETGSMPKRSSKKQTGWGHRILPVTACCAQAETGSKHTQGRQQQAGGATGPDVYDKLLCTGCDWQRARPGAARSWRGSSMTSRTLRCTASCGMRCCWRNAPCCSPSTSACRL